MEVERRVWTAVMVGIRCCKLGCGNFLANGEVWKGIVCEINGDDAGEV